MVNLEDLKRIYILRNMPLHILEKITQEARICILEKGSVLFKTGERNEVFYMLTMGQVTLNLELNEDIDVIFEILQAGSSFGLLSLLKGAVSSYSAVCQEACEAITLNAPRMFELFEKDPEFAFYMLKGVASQYQHLIQTRATMRTQAINHRPNLQRNKEDMDKKWIHDNDS